MASPWRLLQEAGLVRHNLIVFALLTAAFNGIVTASIGGFMAQTYASHQSQRQYVQNIADLIYERHTRARMVLSSVRRGADLDEIRYRKRTYDEVFVEWNKKIQNNVLPIRQAMGAADATVLETQLQTLLVPAMGELDVCLTKIYDLKLAGQDFSTLLDQCQREELSRYILDCGSGITDELYRFTRLTFVSLRLGGTREIEAARERIKTACVRTFPMLNPPTALPPSLSPSVSATTPPVSAPAGVQTPVQAAPAAVVAPTPAK